MRIGEDADVIEGVIGDERAQLVDVGLGLAGETDDEGGAEGDAGDALADAVEQRVVGWRACPAASCA